MGGTGRGQKIEPVKDRMRRTRLSIKQEERSNRSFKASKK